MANLRSAETRSFGEWGLVSRVSPSGPCLFRVGDLVRPRAIGGHHTSTAHTREPGTEGEPLHNIYYMAI